MRSRYWPATLCAAIFLGAATGHAALDQPGVPGVGTPAMFGGANASPVLTITSIARSVAETAANTREAADNTNKLLSLLTSEHDARHRQDQGRAAYLAGEERFTGRQAAVITAHTEVGPSGSMATPMTLSAMPTAAATGLVGDAFLRAYGNHPPPEEARYGAGGTAIQAFRLLIAACRARCLLPHEAEQLARSGRYGACSSDPQVAGQCTRTAGLISSPQGIVIGPGQPQSAAVGVLLSMVSFGPVVNAQMQAGNYTSVQQLVQADVQQYFAAKEGKRFAVFDGHSEYGPLLHKVDTRSAAEDHLAIMRAMGTNLSGRGAADQILSCLRNRVSMPGGGNMYDAQCALAQARTGQPCPVRPGFIPSHVNEARMAASAAARQADAQAPQQQSPGTRDVYVGAQAGTRRTILAGLSAASECSPASLTALSMSLQQLASVLMTPDYNAFVANLSEKEINEQIAYVKKRYDMLGTQIAENYRDFTRELEGGGTYYAEGHPSSPTLKDMFARSNLDLGILNSGASPFVSIEAVLASSVKAAVVSRYTPH